MTKSDKVIRSLCEAKRLRLFQQKIHMLFIMLKKIIYSLKLFKRYFNVVPDYQKIAIDVKRELWMCKKDIKDIIEALYSTFKIISENADSEITIKIIK